MRVYSIKQKLYINARTAVNNCGSSMTNNIIRYRIFLGVYINIYSKSVYIIIASNVLLNIYALFYLWYILTKNILGIGVLLLSTPNTVFKTHPTIWCENTPMVCQTFIRQIWWVMVCYDLAHLIRCAKHTFSGRCGITPMVCCSFGGYSTPQFLQCMSRMLHPCRISMWIQ